MEDERSKKKSCNNNGTHLNMSFHSMIYAHTGLPFEILLRFTDMKTPIVLVLVLSLIYLRGLHTGRNNILFKPLFDLKIIN